MATPNPEFTDPLNSPDLDILNPEGCRTLLQIGEKALAKLMQQGLPHVPTSNSYRFVRQRVIEWMGTEGERIASRQRDSSDMEDDP